MQQALHELTRHLRHGTLDDLVVIDRIYAYARWQMAATGNPTQWGAVHPPSSQIREDLERRRTLLLVDNGPSTTPHRVDADADPAPRLTEEHAPGERVLAVFAVCKGPDPTYGNIDGAWLDGDPYVALHRVASSGLARHTARDCLLWAVEEYGNVRVDTHRNNGAMQHVLSACGFTRCGIISLGDYFSDDVERIAYQRHDH